METTNDLWYRAYPGWCSFCRKSHKEIGPLAEGPDHVYICFDCAVRCANLIQETCVQQQRPVSQLKMEGMKIPRDYVPVRASTYALWLVLALCSTVIVGLHDGWLWTTWVWMCEVTTLGCFRIPKLSKKIQSWVKTLQHGQFLMSAACGSAISVGAPVGILAGVLLPVIYQLNFPSHLGGLIGLLIGPCVAAYYGFLSYVIVAALSGIIGGMQVVVRRVKISAVFSR